MHQGIFHNHLITKDSLRPFVQQHFGTHIARAADIREILCELGYSEDSFEEMLAAKVTAEPDPG